MRPLKVETIAAIAVWHDEEKEMYALVEDGCRYISGRAITETYTLDEAVAIAKKIASGDLVIYKELRRACLDASDAARVAGRPSVQFSSGAAQIKTKHVQENTEA